MASGPSIRLNSIQILRFVAAALVVAVHAAKLSIGFIGVDIFFVISGFIIAGVLPRQSIGQFARARFTRIFPIYWICALLRTAQLLPQQGWSLGRAITTFTLWPITGGFTFPYLVVGWTLSFELLFYVAAGTTLLNRRAAPALGACYVAAVALAFATGWPLFRYLGSPLIFEFLLGVGIAKLPSRSSKVLGGIAIPLALVLIAVATTPAIGIPENVISLAQWQRPILWGLPAALLVWGALQFEDNLKGKAASWLAAGGDASYSIYLVHPLMLDAALWLVSPVLAIAWLLIVGVAVHRYLEAPLLRRLRSKQPRKVQIGDRVEVGDLGGSDAGGLGLPVDRLSA